MVINQLDPLPIPDLEKHRPNGVWLRANGGNFQDFTLPLIRNFLQDRINRKWAISASIISGPPAPAFAKRDLIAKVSVEWVFGLEAWYSDNWNNFFFRRFELRKQRFQPHTLKT